MHLCVTWITYEGVKDYSRIVSSNRWMPESRLYSSMPLESSSLECHCKSKEQGEIMLWFLTPLINYIFINNGYVFHISDSLAKFVK